MSYVEAKQRYEKIAIDTEAVLEKMKEVWGFYCYNFEKPEKLLKKIRKTQTLEAYLSVMREVFS